MDRDSPFADPDRPEPLPQSLPTPSGSNSLKASIFEQSRIVHPSTSVYRSASRPRHDDIREESYHESIQPSVASLAAASNGGQHGSYTGNGIHSSHTQGASQSNAYEDEDEEEQDPEDLLSDEELGLIAGDARRASPTTSRGSSRSRNRRTDTSDPRSRASAVGGLSAKQKALWLWANVDNLDAFLQEVYAYYVGRGAICIALSRSILPLYTPLPRPSLRLSAVIPNCSEKKEN